MPGSIAGVVVSAGKMMKTVKVRIAQQAYNSHIRKHFPAPTNLLVSDPRSSLREGDIVQLASGWRTSKHVRHVVTSIIAPFGPPIEQRPPVPTEEERVTEREAKQARKKERREARRVEGVQPPPKGKVGPIQERAREGKNRALWRFDKAMENEEDVQRTSERLEGEGRIGEEVAKGFVGR
ncbi:MAG: hypothetical protein M1827_001665 [Pycnora praestabilis]|nr:MAG: hypothetical protein M1827_001665 [Pycnora praestabilis]